MDWSLLTRIDRSNAIVAAASCRWDRLRLEAAATGIRRWFEMIEATAGSRVVTAIEILSPGKESRLRFLAARRLGAAVDRANAMGRT
jgi:hypothetical protein